MARRIITIALATFAALAGMAAPGSTGAESGPASSGAVSRFSEPGMQGLFDPAVKVGDAELPLIVLYNIASPGDLCGFTLAGDGDLMVVETPSGNRNFVLHDDVPIMIFDATGLGETIQEVFPNLFGAVCGPAGLQPIATGEATVRNKVHFSEDTFHHQFDASGAAEGLLGSWRVTAHRRAEGTIPGPPDAVDDTIVVAVRG